MAADINTVSYFGLTFDHIVLDDIVPLPEHSDALHISRCRNLVVEVGTVVGGREDCVDVNNHCFGVSVTARGLFEPRGLYLATVKGGSANVTLRGKVDSHGKVVDVDLGNVSDQSDNLTGPVYLALEHIRGEPITYRVLGAEDPIILNGDTQKYVCTFRLWKPLRAPFLKVYKQLKKFLPI